MFPPLEKQPLVMEEAKNKVSLSFIGYYLIGNDEDRKIIKWMFRQ